MAQLEIFEGTWEELVAYAEAFKGRKIRLIILSQETAATGTLPEEGARRETALSLFTEADNTVREPGKPSHDPLTGAFGEIITEKYRAMGLRL